MNILITAGGTTEKIDSVRSISNMSTGRLGSLIAGGFSDHPAVQKIFYVCSRTAVKPQVDKIEFVHADSVSDLENAIREVLKRAKIDVIIHSMAVSDYRVKAVTTLSALLEKSGAGGGAEPKVGAGDIARTEGKISSDVDDMVLLMERTPKIISLFQELSPDSTLVGFKLLDNVELETLIDKGFEVLTKNRCSFVLANDLKDVGAEKHIGYLIDKEKNATKFMSKADIAAALVSACVKP